MAKPIFKYTPRSEDSLRARSERGGGLYDSLFLSGFHVFVPKEGDNSVRLLPPTWDLDQHGRSQADHYGFSIWVHYNVGPDKQSYLCPRQMNGDPCPICDERTRLAWESGTEETVRQLRPSERVVVWCIDRDNEGAGPQIWSMSVKIDADLASRARGKRTGEMLFVDDPDQGYDIEFRREGKGLTTQYLAIDIARRSTPLSSDPAEYARWMQMISDHPVPDVLQFFDEAHIRRAFGGPVEEAEPVAHSEYEPTEADIPEDGQDPDVADPPPGEEADSVEPPPAYTPRRPAGPPPAPPSRAAASPRHGTSTTKDKIRGALADRATARRTGARR